MLAEILNRHARFTAWGEYVFFFDVEGTIKENVLTLLMAGQTFYQETFLFGDNPRSPPPFAIDNDRFIIPPGTTSGKNMSAEN